MVRVDRNHSPASSARALAGLSMAVWWFASSVLATAALAASLPQEPEPPQTEESAAADRAMEAENAAIAKMLEPFSGDLGELVERRYIRMLVPLSRTHYFLDKGQQFGAAYEGGKQFEEWLNKRLGSGVVKVQVVFIPVSRDRVFAALAEGRGDLAAGNLTITDERKEFADFATPFASDVSEIVVTAKGGPSISKPEDLSGLEVSVRRGSSYRSSLEALNVRLRAAGKAEVAIVQLPDLLEDEDVLEMVSAGLVSVTVVDAHLVEFWSQTFDDLVVLKDVKLRENASIGWAVRKGCPKLLDAASDFCKEHRKGTLLYNLIYKKYLKSTKYVKGATKQDELKKFRALLEMFRKYGKQYDIPWLLLAALAYQESKLDQSVTSSAGAVGVMQIKPSTAEGKPIEIHGVEKSADRNIEAGTKYLRFIADKHVNEPELDRLTKGLFVIASYNAGPSRIAKLRKAAAARGLDPNRWFGNVEVVVAKEIGRETVEYVANIYKYYVSYQLVVEQMIARGEIPPE